jgi:hypothetical protein
MTRPAYPIAWLLVATLLAVVSEGQHVCAQDDNEADIKIEEIPRQQLRERVVRLKGDRRLLVAKTQLDRWIVNRFGTAAGIRDNLETRLAGRLDVLRITCSLTNAQTKKLRLAGRGDIKRFMDRLEFADGNVADAGAGNVQDFALDIDEVDRALEKLFDVGSLFSKTLVTTLSVEQFAREEKVMRDKNSARYLLAVTDTVRRLARVADLSDGQSEKLSRLILLETAPPREFGQSDYAFVMFQASRLPAAKLEPIFLGPQWKELKQQLASWNDAGTILKSEGFVFGDIPASSEARSRAAAGPIAEIQFKEGAQKP